MTEKLVAEKNTKRVNRMFQDSFLNIPMYFRDFLIDLSTACSTEKTVFNLIMAVGFDLQMSGTKYLLRIIVKCVNDLHCPVRTQDYYRIVTRESGLNQKAVEIAVSRAIGAINLGKIKELNRLLGGNVIHLGAITAGDFLSGVCTRLILLKCHQEGKTFFA